MLDNNLRNILLEQYKYEKKIQRKLHILHFFPTSLASTEKFSGNSHGATLNIHSFYLNMDISFFSYYLYICNSYHNDLK
jgi:hypothetical protein